MEAKMDKVTQKWLTHCKLSDEHLNPDIVWKQSYGCSNNNRVYHGERETGSKTAAICSRGYTSSVAARRNWSCAENSWSMRGSLNSTLEGCDRIEGFHQEASAVEKKVEGLQDRVSHLVMVIVDHVTAKSEEGNKEAIEDAAKGIEEDIKGLLRCVPGEL